MRNGSYGQILWAMNIRKVKHRCSIQLCDIISALCYEPVTESVQANVCLMLFPFQNGLKQGDALLPSLFNLYLEYVIWKF
jgi:hypothetical protein